MGSRHLCQTSGGRSIDEVRVNDHAHLTPLHQIDELGHMSRASRNAGVIFDVPGDGDAEPCCEVLPLLVESDDFETTKALSPVSPAREIGLQLVRVIGVKNRTVVRRQLTEACNDCAGYF